VSADTTRVLMEVATWNGANLHRTGLKLGLRSEASSRNEKQLQPEQAMQAQILATQLMVQVCGATVVPGTIDVAENGPPVLPELQTIRLRDARVSGLLGLEIPRARCAEILTALECTVADAPDGLDVTVPAFRRSDVTREADLIEEVARLGALEDLPATLPARRGASGRLTPSQRLRRTASDTLAGQGLSEIVGWSFEGPELAERLRIAERPVVTLRNPMSAEQSRLRTTLLGSLLEVAQRNLARNSAPTRPLALFEAGGVYLPQVGAEPPATDEPYHVGALLHGPVRPATWRAPAPPRADFFAAKGVLGALLDTIQAPWELAAGAESDAVAFLHPARQATVTVAGAPVGWIGELHPTVAAQWDIEDPVPAFELDLDAVAAHVRVPEFRDVTSYPEVREDLAVVVADSVSAAEVLGVVREAGGNLLAGAEVFDVYRDAERVGEGNVSLALRLRFRASDRTLTDDEVSGRRRRIARALTERLEGRVRDS
jgi:phenylalanyl-tRNA synthetase beta chain